MMALGNRKLYEVALVHQRYIIQIGYLIDFGHDRLKIDQVLQNTYEENYNVYNII